MKTAPTVGSRRSIVLVSVVVLVVLAGLTYWAWPLLSTFTDPASARATVERAGAWGPLVVIGLQVVQVIIAPIPGQITALAAGYLFGPVLGIVYTTIGATIGFTIVFLLSRTLGRRFVERFVRPDLLDRFDHLAGSRGTLALFLIYLLPVFPDDLISFVAGLTPIPLRTLVAVSLAGRLPGYVVLSLGGDGLAYNNMNLIVVGGIALVLLAGLGWWKRAWLTDMVA